MEVRCSMHVVVECPACRTCQPGGGTQGCGLWVGRLNTHGPGLKWLWQCAAQLMLQFCTGEGAPCLLPAWLQPEPPAPHAPALW